MFWSYCGILDKMDKGGRPVEFELTLKPSQVLSPQMVQSVKILQMGTMELAEYIGKMIQ